jgi:FemAB-related protein (PEP-CTERM system-associated)
MSVKDIDIRQAGSIDRNQWDDYAMVHADGLAYHLFAWKLAIEEAYDFACPYFIALRQKQIVGVLPIVHIHHPISKGKLVSLPYCDVGGILADSPEIAEALFKYACHYALKFKIPRIEIRYSSNIFNQTNSEKLIVNVSENSHAESYSYKKVRMLLDLPTGSEELLSSFKSKLRSQIKKPGREGLIVKIGGKELLGYFYKIFAENMKSLGSPVHSKKWIESIIKFFEERAKCGIVFMPDNTPAAGGIILCHENAISLPWASSLRRFNNFNPNMLLYWSFLKFAVDNGYRLFDFGRSTPGEGTYNFKLQWGAQPEPLFWQQWVVEKSGVHAERMEKNLSSNDRSRKLAEKIIQQLPLSIATYLGSRIRKYISL